MERPGVRNPIRVEYDTPFSVPPPNLQAVPLIDSDADPLIGSAEFLLDGKWKGRVAFLIHVEVDQDLAMGYSPLTPAGPIEVKCVLENDTFTPVENSFPIEIELDLEVDDSLVPLVPNIDCEMLVEGERFRLEPDYDDVPDPKDGHETLRLYGYKEGPFNPIPKPLLLPPDPDLLRKVQFKFSFRPDLA